MLNWKHLFLPLVLACTACGPQKSNRNTASSGKGDPSQLNANLCAEYIKRNLLQVALQKCERSLKQNRGNASAHKWKAILHQRLGQDKLAARHFQRAVDLAPNDSGSHNNYGAFLCRQKRFQQAEQQFLKAINNPLYRARHIAYTNAGLCMISAGDKRKAEYYFRKTLRLAPLFGPALINMARLSHDNNKCISALGFMRRWAKKNRWSSENLWLAVKIEKKCGNSNKLASLGLLLKARFPTSPAAMKYKQWSRGQSSW